MLNHYQEKLVKREFQETCKISIFTNKIQNTSQNSRLVDASRQKIKTEECSWGLLQKNG